MSDPIDGPRSPRFKPVPLIGNTTIDRLKDAGVSDQMQASLESAPVGTSTAWGILFDIGSVVVLRTEPVSSEVSPLSAEWLVFMHTSDTRPPDTDENGIISPMSGQGHLRELAATYIVQYADGTSEHLPIRRRHQIGAFQRTWGENCFEAVAHHKSQPVRASHEQTASEWGRSQTRASAADGGRWVSWLWAWQNPHPEKSITGITFKPGAGTVVVSALSAGSASEQPLRWRTRRKAMLTLPDGEEFRPSLSADGLLEQIQLDMGQVISATPRSTYPNETWADSYNNQIPQVSEREILIEYTAHPDACFHLSGGQTIPVSQVESALPDLPLQLVPPAKHRVTIRTVERATGKCVPVKLHLHGQFGEYLAPTDRHRIANPAWFEDYSVDFVHRDTHTCTYISGETTVDLPLGKVFVEVSKGFEIKPLRQVVEIAADTETIEIEIEKVLPWRERGWVTADTHVHFLSPMSALLEGSAEGVNVINLLASQWGELMTNVGDFDGKTTWGSEEAGGDGEHLVRVGTENRQHVMGHISLLGYEGNIIAPMTTGGPDESAIGDPIEILLTEWAQQVRKQGGLAILPHFPNPRAENAASIVSGTIHGVEMTSWGDLYSGISPYSLSDWYRYLNCGYLVPAVGGTDKMSASTAVGTVRTYARIEPGRPFDYETWKEAVRRCETFVTYGPLMEFSIDGHPMGTRIAMSANGGTVDVTWEATSITVPMSRVDLIVNGEIRESVAVDPWKAAGNWSVRVDRSSWLALLVRGHYADKPEIVAAHSTPVMVDVAGSQMIAAADAVTILEQIEGALAYIDTVGTRADERAYKRMRLVLTSAHRSLHNRMHQGHYHDHTHTTDHAEHH